MTPSDVINPQKAHINYFDEEDANKDLEGINPDLSKSGEFG